MTKRKSEQLVVAAKRLRSSSNFGSKFSVSRRSYQRRQGGALAKDATVYSYIVNPPRAPVAGDQIFKLSQTVLTQAWHTTNSSLATFNNVTFAVSAIDQINDLAGVFDQYRIDSVEVHITNQNSNFNMANSGRYVTVIDHDDNTNFTLFNTALDYPSALVSGGQSCQYRHFVPRIATAAYSGAFTSFANQKPQWIDMASSNVVHYGLKAAFTGTSTSLIIFDLTVVLHCSFRSVR